MFELRYDNKESPGQEPRLTWPKDATARPGDRSFRTAPVTKEPAGNLQDPLETILVVDDEPAVLDLVKFILSRAGYRVLVADSGPKALEICHQHGGTIDLLLTDVMMPGMSGVALAQRLKSLSQNVPVLYMTGGTLESLADGELDPESALVRKPFDPPLLVSTIKEFLTARRGSSS